MKNSENTSDVKQSETPSPQPNLFDPPEQSLPKKPMLNIFRMLLVLVGVGIFFLGVYGIYQRTQNKSVRPTPPVVRTYQEILNSDLKRMENVSQLKKEEIPSLMRLARQKNPMIKEKLNVFFKSTTDTQLKVALFKASGFYDDLAFEERLVQTFRNEKDENLILAAIEGLSQFYSQSRQKILRDSYLARKNSETVQLALIEGLYKMNPAPTDVQEYEKDLIKYLKNPKNKNLFMALQIYLNQAAREGSGQGVNNTLPRKDYFDFLKEILANSQYNPELRSVAFSTLSSQQELWLKGQYDVFFKEDKYFVEPFFSRMLQAMGRLCPANRWLHLEKIFTDKKYRMYRIDALKVVEQINESRGVDLLSEMVGSSDTFQPQELPILTQTLSKLREQIQKGVPSACKITP